MIGPDSSPVVEAVATAGSDGSDCTVLGGWATGSLESSRRASSSATAGGTTTVSTPAAFESSADPLPAFCAVASTEPSDLASSSTESAARGGSSGDGLSASDGDRLAPGGRFGWELVERERSWLGGVEVVPARIGHRMWMLVARDVAVGRERARCGLGGHAAGGSQSRIDIFEAAGMVANRYLFEVGRRMGTAFRLAGGVRRSGHGKPAL
jgi:hypothetical protein